MNRYLISVCFSVVLLVGLCPTVQSRAETHFAPVLHDTYIDGSHPDTAYGGAVLLNLYSYVGSPQRTALMFDLGGVPAGATIVNARLWLHNNSYYGDSGTFLCHLEQDGWDEATATWDLFEPWFPAPGEFNLAYELVVNGQWVSWEIDPAEWPWAADLEDGRATFLLRSAENGYYSGGGFQSKEAEADHPYLELEYVATVEAGYACLPESGTVPFQPLMTLTLHNLYAGQSRQLAARINLDLATGGQVVNWRAGYTNVAAGGSYTTSWLQTIPALGSLIGENTFTLVAADVTPSPWNQPPYPPAGDTDTALCSLTAFAP